MTHIRTQIRTRVAAVLVAALPDVGYAVSRGRRSPINHNSDVTQINLLILNDQQRNPETMGTARIGIASIYIRVQKSANEAELDDLLDADEVIIAAAMEAEDWSDLLEEQPEREQVNFSFDPDAGNTLGEMVLRYDLEYRINRGDVENVIV